jgi:RecA-family ATPase
MSSKNKEITEVPEAQENKKNNIHKEFYNGEELLSLETVGVPFLLDKILPSVAVGALGGSSDTGKSAFLRQLAMAIVSGEDEFLGFKINAVHRSVVYVSTEDDETATSHLMRVQNQKKHPYQNFKKLRFIFNSEDLLHKLKEKLKKAPADCIIIDTFTDIYGDDLNSSNKVRKFINDFYNVAKEHKCLLLFLHHTGKKTETLAPHKDNLLGSQGFEAKMRVVLELRKDFQKDHVRHLCIVKGNYIPSDLKKKSFVLEFDNNLVFTNTNTHVPFDQLAKDFKGKKKDTSVVDALISELTSKGYTTRQIAETLKSTGIKIEKSTVNKRQRKK